MKIVHIMRPSLFIKGVVGFYDKNFNDGIHDIVYYLIPGEDSQIQNDVTLSQTEFVIISLRDRQRLINKIKKYDYIVFHSLFFDTKFKLLLGLNRAILRKSVWIEFGADLYSWKNVIGIKRFIVNSIQKKIINNVAYFVGIFPPDCDYFKNEFPKARAKVFYAPYMGKKISNEFYEFKPESSLNEHLLKGQSINIQIGHNAFTTLNHIEVLDALSRFKDKNIKLLLPLSYGDESYGNEVQAYAEKLFPGKVLCLRKLLPKDEYFNLTKDIDIAIFNTYRQAGLGNINRLILRNVKIYMPEQSVMYKYFNERGVSVYSYDKMLNSNYDEFIQGISGSIIQNNYTYISELIDIEKRTDTWRVIYKALNQGIDDQKISKHAK